MANLIVLDTGKQNWLKILADLSAAEKLDSLWVALYTNDYVPAHDDVLVDYTEAGFAGYARQQITALSAVTLSGDFHAQTLSNTLTFSNATGVGQNVYGLFIVDAAGVVHDLLAAARFDGSPIVIPAGGTLAFAINFTATSEF